MRKVKIIKKNAIGVYEPWVVSPARKDTRPLSFRNPCYRSLIAWYRME